MNSFPVHPLFPEVAKAWEKAVPFQLEDVYKAAERGSNVFGHGTGLGKTFMAILAWSMWPNAKKGIVLGTKSSSAVWTRLLTRWTGYTPTILHGFDHEPWREVLEAKEGIWLCTYASFRYLMSKTTGKPEFDVVVCDELHRVLRHRNQTWKDMCRLQKDHFLGLSATWSSRGPQDLYPVLYLMARGVFPSYWRFVETWCHVETTTFGKDIFGVRNVENLRWMLHGQYYCTRDYADVVSQFRSGASTEQVIRRTEMLPMDEKQASLYHALDSDMVAELDGAMVVTPNSLSKLTRLMQIALCPRSLFPTAPLGSGIEFLCDKVQEDKHTVIFAPFKAVLDGVTEALLGDKYPMERIQRLDGNVKTEDIDPIIAKWKEMKGVMLCTIDFAQSFELDTTHTAYMLGFDWDPNDNTQAEGRLRRMDSILQSPCIVTYIIIEGTVYEDVREVVNGKLHTTRQFLSDRIKGGEHDGAVRHTLQL